MIFLETLLKPESSDEEEGESFWERREDEKVRQLENRQSTWRQGQTSHMQTYIVFVLKSCVFACRRRRLLNAAEDLMMKVPAAAGCCP